MNVKIIDIKSGAVKTMPERYAKILVKAKRARWPEAESKPQGTTVITGTEQVSPVVVVDPDVEPAIDVPNEPKKRGRKPKAQDQE
ncbi:hypothetical protein N0406_03545 [Pseudomonas aeruginosa]|nr:hypothetical protein [Pseudomonas aeruginosa]